MSLTKSFNFKFIKQMLKKSKGQLILFLGLVPIFTFLVLMAICSEDIAQVLNIESIGALNFIGIYFIPIILSINLFSYIYKRSSVDFINSMPISKKNIFINNSIIGIILIILMQLINVGGIFLFSALKPNITVIPEMVWDVFIISSLSYIFIFTATNLAMCLSGNVITQIVVTCLIVFFVPFLINDVNESLFTLRSSEVLVSYNEINEKWILRDQIENREMQFFYKINEFHDTTPYKLLEVVSDYNSRLYFDTISNIKMIVLSFVYLILGANLFKRRKFENLGESFSSVKVHQFVKALVFFPLFTILNKINMFSMNIEFILFVFAALIALFFIYDIVTNKKVKLKNSMIYIVLIFIVGNGICYGVEKVIDNKKIRVYNIKDIESVSVNIDDMRGYETGILEYEIKDKEMIENIIKASDHYVSLLKIKTNDGNEYFDLITYGIDISYTPWEHIIDYLKLDEGYVNKYKEEKLADGYYVLVNDIPIKGELLEKVDKYVTEYQKNNIETDIDLSNEIFVVRKYIYKNHRLTYTNYVIEDEEIRKILVEEYNNKFKEKFEKLNENEFYSFTIKNYYYGYNAYVYEDAEKLINLIKNDKLNSIDLNKEHVVVYYYDIDNNAYHITNNEEIIKLYYEVLNKMDPENTEKKYYYNNNDELVEVLPSGEMTEEVILEESASY